MINNLAVQSDDMQINTKNQYDMMKTVLRNELTEEEHGIIDDNQDNPYVIYIKFTEATKTYEQKRKLKEEVARNEMNDIIEEKAKKEFNGTVKKIFAYGGIFIGSAVAIFTVLSFIIYVLMELLVNEQVDLLVIIGAAGAGTFFIMKWLVPFVLVVLIVAKVKASRFKAKQLVDDATSSRPGFIGKINKDGLKSAIYKNEYQDWRR